MLYRRLGNTGLQVSHLCFGTLSLGPLQNNLSSKDGSEIIFDAFNKGVNLIDTAEIYGTYPHIKAALQKLNSYNCECKNNCDPLNEPIIITKSYAYTAEGARASVEKAFEEIGIDRISIFMLHEQESRLTLRGHREALEYYLSCKQKGLIKAVGVSTHNCEVVESCAEMPEIDVIEALVNKDGIGIGDGTIDRMLSAIKKAYDAGKGIVAMKTLGGGNLFKSYSESINFVKDLPYIHSLAIGMKSSGEVELNSLLIEGGQPDAELLAAISSMERRLHVEYWCEGCGKCIKRCKNGALSMAAGQAEVDRKKCIMCCYCAGVCPVFAIKII